MSIEHTSFDKDATGQNVPKNVRERLKDDAIGTIAWVKNEMMRRAQLLVERRIAENDFSPYSPGYEKSLEESFESMIVSPVRTNLQDVFDGVKHGEYTWAEIGATEKEVEGYLRTLEELKERCRPKE